MCTTPIHTFLQNIEQIPNTNLLITLKSGWSDVNWMCFTLKKSNKQLKKHVNRFLQDSASASL